MFVTPHKFPIIEGALKIGIKLPLFFLEISLEQTKICFHQINQIFQKTYVRHSHIELLLSIKFESLPITLDYWVIFNNFPGFLSKMIIKI